MVQCHSFPTLNPLTHRFICVNPLQGLWWWRKSYRRGGVLAAILLNLQVTDLGTSVHYSLDPWAARKFGGIPLLWWLYLTQKTINAPYSAGGSISLTYLTCPLLLTSLDLTPQKRHYEWLWSSSASRWHQESNKQTSISKASGIDDLLAEIFTSAGPKTQKTFINIMTNIWEEEIMLNDFYDAIICTLFKNKCHRDRGGNYCGISLLSTMGKILVHMILNRLISSASKKCLPESQCGFRLGHSTVDMIFSLRQVWEKCIKQQLDIYAILIDLNKAFDTVNRGALWIILTKLGCPKNNWEHSALSWWHDGYHPL